MRSFSLIAIAVLLVAPAFAAWDATDDRAVDFDGVIGEVRDDIDEWLEDNADDIDRGTKAILKAADKILARALKRVDENPEWRDTTRALEACEDAVRLLAIARSANRKNKDFVGFVADAGEDLYRLSRAVAISAADYVNDNFDTRKATKKLLAAGAKVTKAKKLAGANKPKYAKAIKLNAKAVSRLGMATLLDDVDS